MKRYAIGIMLLLLGLNIFSQELEVCFSEEEVTLANHINRFRQRNDLETLKLSPALSYVADVHVKDLYLNFNPYGVCNLHFWSDRGRWKPCCPAGETEELKCMYDKPYELTGYKGKGFELVFYQNSPVSPDGVFEYWRTDSAFMQMVLEKGRFDDKKWNAMGVALFEGYASVWLGERADNRPEPPLCSDTATLRNSPEGKNQEPVPQYYIFVSSHARRPAAQKALKALKEEGYKQSGIYPYRDRFRIGLGPYGGYSKAKAVKQKLPRAYGDAWIQRAR